MFAIKRNLFFPQIDTLLRDAEKAECMVSRVDQLLVTISLQYRMVYNRYMSDPDTSKYEVIKLYRLLTGTISSVGPGFSFESWKIASFEF